MISVSLLKSVGSEIPPNQAAIEKDIVAMATGDKDALCRFYTGTKGAVYGYALATLRNRDDAEDVLQSTYINVYSNAHRYICKGKPMAWVFTIARNLCMSKLREQSKTIYLSDDSLCYLPSEDTATGEDKLVLEAVLSELPEMERQIVMLHAVAGLKHREIAQFMGIPLSTALSKYNRSIKRLNILLKEGSL